MRRRTLVTASVVALAGCDALDGGRRNGQDDEEGDDMAIYIVAVRRERRAEVSVDWIDTLRETPGVEVTAAGAGPVARRRVRIRATHTGIETLRERVGEWCHIERLTVHRGGPADPASPANPASPASPAPPASPASPADPADAPDPVD